MLVFSTTQNNPLKVHIGSDSIEFSMPDGYIVCELNRGGVKTQIACESKSELVIKFNEKVIIRLQRRKNQVSVYIKADDDIQILRDKHVHKASDKSLST